MIKKGITLRVGMWLALALFAGGCGSSEPARRGEPLEQHGRLVPATDMSRLMGRSFVLVAAQGFAPSAASRITFYFRRDGGFGFSGGCNSFDGTVSLRDGGLIIHTLSGTEMACGDGIDQQEGWLFEFMMAKPRVMLEGDFWIRLIGNDATLVFFEADRAELTAPAPPDAPLVGTTWRISELHGDQLGNVHSENDSTLVFHENGRLSINTTCSNGTGHWAYWLDERDLTLSEVSYTQTTCSDSDALLDSHLRQVLADGTVNVAFGSARLFITRGGLGITAVTP